jgi:hypothetical protein
MSDSCSEAAESVSDGNAAPLFRSLWEVRRCEKIGKIGDIPNFQLSSAE